MALLSKKEFAQQCGLKTNTLAVSVLRGSVVVGADERIDTDNGKNNAFLAKRQALHGATPTVAIKPPKVQANITADFGEDDDPEEDETDDQVSGKTMPLAKSERRKKHYDAIRAEKAAELDQLKIDKLKGIVVPSALLGPLFIQHNQAIVQSFKDATDDMLRQFAKRHRLKGEEVAEYRTQITTRINEAAVKAAEVSVRQLEVLVDNYSESRGVGERK